jgi:tRNA (mo5U34)-methyltransferase
LTVEQLPDLRGRTVLDIGAWDGYYSFLAEELGARRVVALDHYAWGVDIPGRDRYWAQCAATGVLPDHGRDTTDFWQADLPGKRGFDLAREALGSSVEAAVDDFATMDLDSLGRFDVVFYIGVLYHMKEPLTALERVRRVTKEVAVIETESILYHGAPVTDGVIRFVAGSDVNRDFGTWFVPSVEALVELCRAAGFRTVESVLGPPSRPRHLRARVRRQLARPRPVTFHRSAVHARP